MANILLFTKVYDTGVNTLQQIETSVQKDIETYFGESPSGVVVKLSAKGDTLYFHLYRIYDDHQVNTIHYVEHNVRLEDCQLFTGQGCLGFRLPHSWRGTPYLGLMPMIVFKEDKELEKAYKESSKALWISVPKSLVATSYHGFFEAALKF